jgi:hypothetical protein
VGAAGGRAGVEPTPATTPGAPDRASATPAGLGGAEGASQDPVLEFSDPRPASDGDPDEFGDLENLVIGGGGGDDVAPGAASLGTSGLLGEADPADATPTSRVSTGRPPAPSGPLAPSPVSPAAAAAGGAPQGPAGPDRDSRRFRRSHAPNPMELAVLEAAGDHAPRSSAMAAALEADVAMGADGGGFDVPPGSRRTPTFTGKSSQPAPPGSPVAPGAPPVALGGATAASSALAAAAPFAGTTGTTAIGVQAGGAAPRPSTAEPAAPRIPPRPPESERREGPPDFAGRIGEVSPAKLLYRFAIARESGLLVLEAGAVIKEIYLVTGSPQHVSSNVAQELLGEYLVARKVISRMELEMALAMLPRFGGKIGDTLIGLNLIRPLDLFRHLTQQVRDKLLDVFSWQRGEYRFYRGRTCPKEVFPLGLDAFEIISGGIGSIPREELAAWFEGIADRTGVASPTTPVRPEDFKLGGLALELHAALDGARSLRQIVSSLRDPDEGRKALYLFLECELVELRSPSLRR